MKFLVYYSIHGEVSEVEMENASTVLDLKKKIFGEDLSGLDLSNIYVLNYLNNDKLPITNSHAEPFIVFDSRNTKRCKLNYCSDYFFLFVY